MSLSSSSSSADIKDLMLSKISNLLIKNNRKQYAFFCVEKEMPVSAIDVTVENVGKLQFPLVKEVIEKLTKNSTEAKFGKGDETLLDKTVRNTNEIKADKLNITINEDLFKNMLNEMRQELGLPETTVLQPRLHNMLIYGPGQFFKKHRDGEKVDGMIASLVIVLPVEHIGGDLIVRHNTEKHVFFSEDIDVSNIKCAAFYADCNHKVKKVLHGNRIVLTYNLISVTQVTHYVHYSNLKLEKLIEKYFCDEELLEIDILKLIYFLDHSYTEHSLRWNMLKGADIKNGSAMYNAARKLNLIPHLALIEISRTSSRNEDDEEILYKYGPRSAHEEMDITFWIDSNNEKLLYDKYRITSEFICCTIKTQNFEPYFKEVEYGNEGYDVDFRYRRAAVILWPVSNDIRMRFILNYDVEKKEFFEMLKVSNRRETAAKIITGAGKYLHDKESLKQKDNFVPFVDFAIEVSDRKVAFELLSYFWWIILDLDITECFVKLKNKYTISFVLELLQKWESKRGYKYLLKTICDIVTKFVYFGVGTEAIQFILQKEYDCISGRGGRSWSERLIEIEELLKACELVKSFHPGTIQTALVDRLTSCNFCPIEHIVTLIMDLQKNFVGTSWFARLKNFAILEATTKKLQSYKLENDWSIVPSTSCKCNHCLILKHFSLSKYKVKKTLSYFDKTAYRRFQQHSRYWTDDISIAIEVSEPYFKVTLFKTSGIHRRFSSEFKKYNSYLLDLNA